jgi:protein associated with RNAse G/E
MAGETEVLDYDDLKIFPDFEWTLDDEIQEKITKHRKKFKSNSSVDSVTNRCLTEGEDETKSTAVNNQAN